MYRSSARRKGAGVNSIPTPTPCLYTPGKKKNEEAPLVMLDGQASTELTPAPRPNATLPRGAIDGAHGCCSARGKRRVNVVVQRRPAVSTVKGTESNGSAS
jgi:hypothetical protein